MKRILFFFIFFFFAQPYNYAASSLDPIGWKTNGGFPEFVVVGAATYIVTYTFTNNIPFQLVYPIQIEKSANTSEFTYTDNCSGLKLTYGQTCTVVIQLNPTTTGQKTVQLTIAGYSYDRVPLPILVTTAQKESGVNVSATLTQALTSPMAVTQQSNFEFTYTNNGVLPATGVHVSVSCPSGSCSSTTTCLSSLNGVGSPSGNSCTQSGVYTVTSATPPTQSVTGTFSYSPNLSVSAQTITNITTGVTLIAQPGLPGVSIENVPYKVNFILTNYTATPLTVSGAPTKSGTSVSFFTQGLTPTPVCVNALVLNTGDSCYIPGTWTATDLTTCTGTNGCTLTATVNYTGPSGSPIAATTSTTLQTSSVTDRTLTFKNKCGFDVWFSLHGGALGGYTCANCPLGSTCGPANSCYWNNYPPNAPDTYKLVNNASATVIIPGVSPITGDIIWSGVASASLTCDPSTSSCAQADCGNAGGTSSCAVGQGFTQPATQAEFSFLSSNIDSYDVEVINGFHIPIEMKPTATAASSGYCCGSAGGYPSSSSGTFGACNWDNAVVPANISYYWVTSGITCSSTSDCANGEICGIGNDIAPHCGNFLGYWTANELCGLNPTNTDTYTSFNCTNTYTYVNPPAGTYNNTELYACLTPGCPAPPATCSAPHLNTCVTYPSADCCGCANWQGLGVSTTASCTGGTGTYNPNWTGNVQNTLLWMKKACPTVYTYPFDDPTSQFTCSSASTSGNCNISGQNTQNYTITFCPGGVTGLPPGTACKGGSCTDGR